MNQHQRCNRLTPCPSAVSWLVVVTVTVAVGMVFVGFMRVFEAGTNDRVLVVGVDLIVVAGAVRLNPTV